MENNLSFIRKQVDIAADLESIVEKVLREFEVDELDTSFSGRLRHYITSIHFGKSVNIS